jgi:hypothetical protein
MITQQRLKELVTYNTATGLFTRNIGIRGQSKGAVCGSKRSNGTGNTYIKILINGHENYAHRLAFLYVDGAIPDFVDHINGDGTDNSWVNLRGVTRSMNMRNSKRSSANKSGVTGVSLINGKFRAVIYSCKTHVYLGLFADKFEAICARKSAELKYKFHPNHGRN